MVLEFFDFLKPLSETNEVAYVINDTSFVVTTGAGANVTKSSFTRGRGEIKEASKNISIFKNLLTHQC